MDQGSVPPPLHVVRIIRIAASVMASLLMAIATLAIWRRYIGAFQTPLPVTTYLLIGLTTIIPSVALRNWWRLTTCPQNLLPLETFWTLCTPSISIFAIFVAVSVPETSLPGILVLGVLFLVSEAMVYRPIKRSVHAKPPHLESITSKANCDQIDRVESLPESADSDVGTVRHLDSEILREIETYPEEGVSQQLVRCRTEDGQDCLKGWIRIDIPAGRRAQSFHLAFCPAFHQTPEIEIHSEDKGSAKRIKTVQCLPYGAHLEVKLSHANPTDETLTLRFQAIGQ